MTGHREIMGLNIGPSLSLERDSQKKFWQNRRILRTQGHSWSQQTNGTAVIDDFGPRQDGNWRVDSTLQLTLFCRLLPTKTLFLWMYQAAFRIFVFTLERPRPSRSYTPVHMLQNQVTSLRTAKPSWFWPSLPFAPNCRDKLKSVLVSILMLLVKSTTSWRAINHDMGHNKPNSHGIDTLLNTARLAGIEKDSPSQTWLTLMPLFTGHRRKCWRLPWLLRMSSMIVAWNYRSYEREWSFLITAGPWKWPNLCRNTTLWIYPTLAYSP